MSSKNLKTNVLVLQNSWNNLHKTCEHFEHMSSNNLTMQIYETNQFVAYHSCDTLFTDSPLQIHDFEKLLFRLAHMVGGVVA